MYYFASRSAPGVDALGVVFFVSNLAAGVSLVLAAPLARRFGLVNTMVFSHIPSNVFLILVAVAPSFLVAALLWVARGTLWQMDVPTRQSSPRASCRPRTGPQRRVHQSGPERPGARGAGRGRLPRGRGALDRRRRSPSREW